MSNAEKTFKIGPLLSVEPNYYYTICFILQQEAPIEAISVSVNNLPMTVVPLENLASGTFYKASLQIQPQNVAVKCEYNITIGTSIHNSQNGSPFEFYIPATTENAQIGYASCNGFSSLKIMKDTPQPYKMWDKLLETHSKESSEFALLVMGGDQVYADGIWQAIPELTKFSEMPEQLQATMPCDQALQKKIEHYYENLYISRWTESHQAQAFATIPTVMMWDDHDIFDGWGSYPDHIQKFEVNKTIYRAAAKYFKIFQLRGRTGLLDQSNSNAHFAWQMNFFNYTILAMDHRSGRSIKEVMIPKQWADIANFLKDHNLQSNLLVLSGVPIVYRDFGFVESMVESTPWVEETTDDLRDHWRSREHQGERMKLIHTMLSELRIRTARTKISKQLTAEDAKTRSSDRNWVDSFWHQTSNARTIVLSGDVHVGALGVVTDHRSETPIKIHQIVSSAIMHPPPTPLEWAGILTATNDRNEYLNEDKNIETEMLKPFGSDKYIRARNFATFKEGSDGKIWINWYNEGKDHAEYPLE